MKWTRALELAIDKAVRVFVDKIRRRRRGAAPHIPLHLEFGTLLDSAFPVQRESQIRLIRWTVALSLSAIVCWLPMAPNAAAQQSAPRPNIVYILADDLGWKDVGFHGSDIKTPSIDQLAQTGARLDQFYVQPMCTPTRAALMTGRYPLRYGLQTLVIPASMDYGLPTDEWLLPQALKAAGYSTAIFGKWHLGHADIRQPPVCKQIWKCLSRGARYRC
jgi:hypothetical protein